MVVERNRFVYEGYLESQNEGRLGCHRISAPVHFGKIQVFGDDTGSEILARNIVALLVNCTKVYQGERRNRIKEPHRHTVYVSIQFQGMIIHSYNLDNVDSHGSPDGFEWGYGGSGPAALAMSILEDHFADHDKAERLHQAFKQDIVATWGSDSWRITTEQIEEWLLRREDEASPGAPEAAEVPEGGARA